MCFLVGIESVASGNDLMKELTVICDSHSCVTLIKQEKKQY